MKKRTGVITIFIIISFCLHNLYAQQATENRGHWNKKHFETVKDMGAMIVRIPVHPIAWHERTPQKYLELLDQAVEWCTELEMYIIIDWHTIGNLKMELFQNPMYNTTQKETFEFWRTIRSGIRACWSHGIPTNLPEAASFSKRPCKAKSMPVPSRSGSKSTIVTGILTKQV